MPAPPELVHEPICVFSGLKQLSLSCSGSATMRIKTCKGWQLLSFPFWLPRYLSSCFPYSYYFPKIWKPQRLVSLSASLLIHACNSILQNSRLIKDFTLTLVCYSDWCYIHTSRFLDIYFVACLQLSTEQTAQLGAELFIVRVSVISLLQTTRQFSFSLFSGNVVYLLIFYTLKIIFLSSKWVYSFLFIKAALLLNRDW